jgi:hypothetical protein
LSRQATSSDTVAPRRPSCGDSRNQLASGADVAGTEVSLAGLDGALGAVGAGAAEHATASAPKLTIATPGRILMSSSACQRWACDAGSDTAYEGKAATVTVVVHAAPATRIIGVAISVVNGSP